MTPIFGLDFTSAPSRTKSITCACGALANNQLCITHVVRFESFDGFEAFLCNHGPWVAGFDFPFGLPRDLVKALRWPETWRALNAHVRMIGKDVFKQSLNRVRESRPIGSKYIERRGDRAAGSSSPMKLVNPPVGLMFYEGATRLAEAGVNVIPCNCSVDSRIALEAYPGFLARQITRESYKKDGSDGNTPDRQRARADILAWLPIHAEEFYSITLRISQALMDECAVDGTGDTLDAVLCCVQAAASVVAKENGDPRYGIPTEADDFEGWIATVAALVPDS